MTDLADSIRTLTFSTTIPFVLGLILGSFFNVCIVRMPQDQSVIFGRSHCPHCEALIPWHLNVPLMSFVWLRGRCHHCHKPISVQYPLVELTTGLLFLFVFLTYGWTLKFLASTVFLSILLVISVIDLHHRIIPDELSLGGTPVGFLFALLLGEVAWWESLLGILVGGAIFFAISYLYERLAHREGLGGGDVKLLAMIGAWLGIKSVLPVIVISSGIGSLVGIGLILFQKKNFKTAIPFGPFLAMAAGMYVFWGERFVEVFYPKIP